MNRFVILSLACLLFSLPASPQEANAPSQVANAPAAQLDTARAGDQQLVNEIIALLNEAVITRLDAKLTLESFKVDQGRVDLRGVRLQNFNLGLRLKPRAAKRLLDLGQRYLGQDQQTASYFDVLRLAVFNDIEIGIHLDELRIGVLWANADELQVQGLVLRAAVNPHNNAPEKTSRDAIATILRNAILREVHVHAGLEKLAATRIQATIQDVSLRGLRVGLALRRTAE